MNERREKHVISVIIPVKNGEKTIEACLESLASQTIPPDEIVVVDNGSTDGTVMCMKEWAFSHPNLQVQVAFEMKAGPGAARNRGAKSAKGKVLAFLDADCVAEPEWIERIEGEFQGGCRAVGGSYGGYLSGHWMEKYVHAARLSLLGKRMPLAKVSLHGAFLVGANSAVETTLFEKVGGYDETLKAGEDFEFSARLIRHGVTPIYNPAIRVLHQSRTSMKERLRRNFLSGLIEVYVFKRHSERKAFLRLFPGRTFEIPSRWRFYLDVWSPFSFLILLGVLFLMWGVRGLWGISPFALLLFLRFGWIMKRGGEKVGLGELTLIVLSWFLEHVWLEAGRFCGTLRYGVLYV